MYDSVTKKYALDTCNPKKDQKWDYSTVTKTFKHYYSDTERRCFDSTLGQPLPDICKNNSLSQKWDLAQTSLPRNTLMSEGLDYYNIQNSFNYSCLDKDLKWGSCKSDNAQLWGRDVYNMIINKESKKCMNYNETNSSVFMGDCDLKTKGNRWKINETSKQISPAGVSKYISFTPSVVQVYPLDNLKTSVYMTNYTNPLKVVPVEDNTYYIQNEVNNVCFSNDTNDQKSYVWYTDPNTGWRCIYINDKDYYYKSAKTNYILCKDDSANNGLKVIPETLENIVKYFLSVMNLGSKFATKNATSVSKFNLGNPFVLNDSWKLETGNPNRLAESIQSFVNVVSGRYLDSYVENNYLRTNAYVKNKGLYLLFIVLFIDIIDTEKYKALEATSGGGGLKWGDPDIKNDNQKWNRTADGTDSGYKIVYTFKNKGKQTYLCSNGIYGYCNSNVSEAKLDRWYLFKKDNTIDMSAIYNNVAAFGYMRLRNNGASSKQCLWAKDGAAEDGDCGRSAGDQSIGWNFHNLRIIDGDKSTTQIKHAYSGNCLTVNSANQNVNVGKVCTETENDDDQRFTIDYSGVYNPGNYPIVKLRSKYSGGDKCLRMKGSTILVETCNDLEGNQKWRLMGKF